MWETVLIIMLSVAAGVGIAKAMQKRPKFSIVSLEPLVFNMPSKDPKKAVKLTSEKIWFLNKGMPEVNNIEMTCERRPAGFYFKPEISYEEVNLDNGSWRLRVPQLKSGATVELFMMNAPTRKKFRFKGGHRIPQETVLFPIASKRVIAGTVFFAALGIIGVLYILAKTLVPIITQYI